MNKKNKTSFVYADLQRNIAPNTIALDTLGTQSDLEKNHVILKEGLTLWFWRDDMEDDLFVFQGTVRFNKSLQKWVAEIDAKTLQNLSKSRFAGEYSPKDIMGS